MNNAEAKCKVKMKYFFAPHAERPQARVRREAIAIALCLKCPMIDECRVAGANEEYGIWGGTTERDRGMVKERVR